MKLISWNVNGIGSCVDKGLLDFILRENADFYCFQEVKSSHEKVAKLLSGLDDYKLFGSFAKKKGYSGVVILSKIKPISVIKYIGYNEVDDEGRIIALEFDKFFLINAYFPHSHRELKRLNFKLKFNKIFYEFCERLGKKKPIMIASDFNVAHGAIDLKNPKQNEKNAGYTSMERNWFDWFLKKGYIDTFREFVSEGGHYTWWTYRNNARRRNIGWRIDYFVVSGVLKNKLKNSGILEHVLGSDHCPITLELDP
ncbi:MAG: exodeoxyribonuclease III [Nanoarchaeota archaeon]